MNQYVIGIIAAVAGYVWYLRSRNRNLEAGAKLADSNVKAAVNDTKIENLQNQAAAVDTETAKAKEEAKSESAEDFWKKRLK